MKVWYYSEALLRERSAEGLRKGRESAMGAWKLNNDEEKEVPVIQESRDTWARRKLEKKPKENTQVFVKEELRTLIKV